MAELVINPRQLQQQNMSRSDSGISTHSSLTSTEADLHVVGIGSSQADLVPLDDEGGGECGWLCLRPQWMQSSRTAKWVLFWLCWASALQGMLVNGFVNVGITTIEKRYNLRSTDTGLIAGFYDIASVVCSVPVSYFGSRPGSSKPRWLGWGVLVMGLGSFIFTIPHFTSPLYDASGGEASTSAVLTCLREGNRNSVCGSLAEQWLSSFRHVFVLGQFLHGVGSAPLYTLGITYLDESVPSKTSALYLGIFYAMAVIGPACGYLLGGEFLKIYIEAPTINHSTLGVGPESELWLGAWWVGFLMTGALCCLVAWPIMAFPPTLPDSKVVASQRESEAHESSRDACAGSTFGQLRDLPQATVALLVNPTFVALSLAGATEGILVAGCATFMPKFLENQLSISASKAALLVGLVAVPAGGGGTLVGGWMLKRLQLRCAGILKMCICLSFLCLLSCLSFIISCPNTNFAGINVNYTDLNAAPIASNLDSDCNANCGCRDAAYNPVCGSNGVMYFSPCHAGCTSSSLLNGTKVFNECSCVMALKGPDPLVLTSWLGNADPLAFLAPGTALRRKCPADCSFMPALLFILFIVMFITFVLSLPALQGTLRCVPDSHRSFALGLQWIVVRLLGTIPGPLLFGAIIDHTCTLWQDTCGSQGSCRSFDNFYMSRYIMSIAIMAKFLSTVLFFFSWWLYVPPKGLAHQAKPDLALSPGPSQAKKDLQGVDNPAIELD